MYLMNRRYPACNRLLSKLRDHCFRRGIIRVPARPLDDILEQYLPATQIDLLNIDAKGMIFRSSKRWTLPEEAILIALEDSG